jgi:hypothetical protein
VSGPPRTSRPASATAAGEVDRERGLAGDGGVRLETRAIRVMEDFPGKTGLGGLGGPGIVDGAEDRAQGSSLASLPRRVLTHRGTGGKIVRVSERHGGD